MFFGALFRISILISSAIICVWTYSHGGPAKSCQTLYPGHGVDKQYGVAPYDIQANLGPSGNVIVTIIAKGAPFAGYMLQARLASDRETTVNGKFSEDKNSQTRNCGTGDTPNTLTHRNAISKYRIETSWTPPRGFVGSVIFRLTIVQSKNVFWTALDSQPVQIAAVVETRPSLAYNKQSASTDRQVDNIQSPSVPQTQSTVRTDAITRIRYEVCDQKFCFGLPVNCIKFKTCNMLLSGGYVPRGEGLVEFEVYADVNKYNGNSYYSMGLSMDNKMGDDSVTDCLISDGRPELKNSINIGRSNEYLSANEYHGVSPLNTSYTNGILYCKWRRRRRSTIRGNPFDLKDKKYYIMIAFGLLTQNDEKEYHTDRLVSEQTVDIRIIGQIETYSTTFLIKLHGAFMVVAWVGCVSIGIFIARYHKPSWHDQTFYGVQIWFAAHRSLMLSTIILIMVSSVAILIHVGTFVPGPHQLFGLFAILIAIGNPIGAAFRPKPDAEKRWLFNWLHFSMGNIGHICAMTALFFAYELSVNQLSQIYLWVLIVYLVFHITSHIFMQIYSCNCRTSSKTSDIAMRNVNHKSGNNNESLENLTKMSFLQFYLFFYIVVIVILIIALIVCIYIPQSSVTSVTKN